MTVYTAREVADPTRTSGRRFEYVPIERHDVATATTTVDEFLYERGLWHTNRTEPPSTAFEYVDRDDNFVRRAIDEAYDNTQDYTQEILQVIRNITAAAATSSAHKKLEYDNRDFDKDFEALLFNK